MRFLQLEIRVAFPGENQPRQSRATQPTVHAWCFSVSIIHQTLTWTTWSLMLMHAIAYGGVPTYVRVSALKVYWETEDGGLRLDGQLPIRTRHSPLGSLQFKSSCPRSKSWSPYTDASPPNRHVRAVFSRQKKNDKFVVVVVFTISSRSLSM